MRLWVLPPQVWLPLALAALAPLVLMAIIVPLSRRRARGIATVLTLRSVLLLGFGLAVLATVATISVVRAGFRELHEHHAPEVRQLSDAIAQTSTGPLGGPAQLALALFRAKDANVAFVVVGTDGCASSCVVSAGDLPVPVALLKDRLPGTWPERAGDQPVLTLDDRAYLLLSAPVLDASGAPADHGLTVLAGIDATYVVEQAVWTAWILLAISYVLLGVVGWTSWRQVSRSIATRMRAITTQIQSGTADESIELLAADGRELRELADSVSSYIKRTLAQQKLNDERLGRLVELSPDAIFTVSTAGIRFANTAAVVMAGARNRRDLLGLPIERFLQLEPRTGERNVSASTLRPAQWTRSDAAVLRVEVAEIRDTIGDDNVRQYVVRDVTHQQAHVADLTHRADHDSLTGLVNRSRFLARVSDLLHMQASRHGAEARDAAVLFIDLDGFKPVNDQHGHAAGDAVLQAVAERLRDSTRSTDVVARLGGDEFAVLIDVRDTNELHVVAERVLTSLRQPVPFDRALLSVGASIGIASSRPVADPKRPLAPGESSRLARELMRAADEAMYAAKSAGGDRISTAGIAGTAEQSTEVPTDVSFPAVA